VEVDPPVELALAGRHRIGGQPPDVEQGIATRQPGHRAVPDPVDGTVHRLAGAHVHDPQGALLVASLRQLVGEQVPLDRGGPRVERDGVVVGQGARVDQYPLLAVLLDEEKGVLLARHPAPEVPTGPDHLGGPHETREQLLQPVPQLRPPREPGEPLGGQLVLRRRPRLGVRTARILEPAVRIGDRPAVDGVDQVGTAGGGIGHRRRRYLRDRR